MVNVKASQGEIRKAVMQQIDRECGNTPSTMFVLNGQSSDAHSVEEVKRFYCDQANQQNAHPPMSMRDELHVCFNKELGRNGPSSNT